MRGRAPGSAGKVTNCQVGVFAAYVSAKGHALVDRQLYLPKAWNLPVPAGGTAAKVAKALPPEAWARLSAGDGTKGPRLYKWAYLELAHLGPDTFGGPKGLGPWTRGLLVRRALGDGALACFTTWCPMGTPPAALPWWRAGAGRSRTPSRRPRPNSAWTTTRPAAGTAGTGTSPW